MFNPDPLNTTHSQHTPSAHTHHNHIVSLRYNVDTPFIFSHLQKPLSSEQRQTSHIRESVMQTITLSGSTQKTLGRSPREYSDMTVMILSDQQTV